MLQLATTPVSFLAVCCEALGFPGGVNAVECIASQFVVASTIFHPPSCTVHPDSFPYSTKGSTTDNVTLVIRVVPLLRHPRKQWPCVS